MCNVRNKTSLYSVRFSVGAADVAAARCGGNAGKTNGCRALVRASVNRRLQFDNEMHAETPTARWFCDVEVLNKHGGATGFYDSRHTA